MPPVRPAAVSLIASKWTYGYSGKECLGLRGGCLVLRKGAQLAASDMTGSYPILPTFHSWSVAQSSVVTLAPGVCAPPRLRKVFWWPGTGRRVMRRYIPRLFYVRTLRRKPAAGKRLEGAKYAALTRIVQHIRLCKCSYLRTALSSLQALTYRPRGYTYLLKDGVTTMSTPFNDDGSR